MEPTSQDPQAPATETGMTKTPSPSSGILNDKVHQLPIRVYYEDTDFTEVVYHAKYLHFFERGRTEFLRCLGVDHKKMLAGDAPHAFSISRIEMDFKKPARIDDALEVQTRLQAIKGPRIIFDQRLYRSEDLICRADVTAVSIWLDGRLRRPPKEELDLWRTFVQPS